MIAVSFLYIGIRPLITVYCYFRHRMQYSDYVLLENMCAGKLYFWFFIAAMVVFRLYYYLLTQVVSE